MHFVTCKRQEIDMNVQVETLETRLRMMEIKVERLGKEILHIKFEDAEELTAEGGEADDALSQLMKVHILFYVKIFKYHIVRSRRLQNCRRRRMRNCRRRRRRQEGSSSDSPAFLLWSQFH